MPQAPPASGSKLRTVASVGADGALRCATRELTMHGHMSLVSLLHSPPFAASWHDWDRSIDGSKRILTFS
jgi:hypothetical protein